MILFCRWAFKEIRNGFLIRIDSHIFETKFFIQIEKFTQKLCN